ncbi:GGDEF domain-containing protein [Elioraea rosea]|uniref:GGDEF domain-containing protein n=1 Tax=Elioraea rosea TaxID=2492390 RepID=UPI00131545CC|nr:GGDEF domain-containing protein [Elioraea rosea]
MVSKLCSGRKLCTRFAVILAVALAPLVMIALQGAHTQHGNPADATSGALPSLIGEVQADNMAARNTLGQVMSARPIVRGPSVVSVLVTALACWIAGVGLAFVLVRRSVAYPLSVLLEVVTGTPSTVSVPTRWRAIPEDFDAIRRSVVAMREATEAREITIQRTHADLEHLATSDGLTGIANRRAFDAALARSWADAARNGSSLALAIFDIDFFKLFNDRYGHLEGDRCLHEVAQTLQGLRVRDGDLAARLGGEEFALLLHRTDLDGAVKVGQRVLSAIRSRRIPHEDGRAGIVTASVGVAACHPHPGLSPLALFAAADAALYLAKSGGRDRLATGLALVGASHGQTGARLAS